MRGCHRAKQCLDVYLVDLIRWEEFFGVLQVNARRQEQVEQVRIVNQHGLFLQSAPGGNIILVRLSGVQVVKRNFIRGKCVIAGAHDKAQGLLFCDEAHGRCIAMQESPAFKQRVSNQF